MKLWAFGDSFTESFETQTGLIEDYKKWKGYTPKNYVDFISENLQIEKINKGKGGTSNRTILSNLIKNINEIEDGDIVIVGWTNIGRFRIVDYNQDIIDVISSNCSIKPLMDTPTIKHLINEYLVIRDHPVFFEELIEYMELINKSFPKCQIFYWTWHHMNLPSYEQRFQKLINLYHTKLFHVGSIEDINTETQGLIQDFHYSENAHRYLAEKILKKIS